MERFSEKESTPYQLGPIDSWFSVLDLRPNETAEVSNSIRQIEHAIAPEGTRTSAWRILPIATNARGRIDRATALLHMTMSYHCRDMEVSPPFTMLHLRSTATTDDYEPVAKCILCGISCNKGFNL
jgi:hypothetical protein